MKFLSYSKNWVGAFEVNSLETEKLRGNTGKSKIPSFPSLLNPAFPPSTELSTGL